MQGTLLYPAGFDQLQQKRDVTLVTPKDQVPEASGRQALVSVAQARDKVMDWTQIIWTKCQKSSMMAEVNGVAQFVIKRHYIPQQYVII